MNSHEVMAIADSKRIKARIEIPEKCLAAGQSAIESYSRGWLKVKHNTNSISILAARPVPTMEIKPEDEKPNFDQQASLVSIEQISKTGTEINVPEEQREKENTETALIVASAQTSSETLSLF